MTTIKTYNLGPQTIFARLQGDMECELSAMQLHGGCLIHVRTRLVDRQTNATTHVSEAVTFAPGIEVFDGGFGPILRSLDPACEPECEPACEAKQAPPLKKLRNL